MGFKSDIYSFKQPCEGDDIIISLTVAKIYVLSLCTKYGEFQPISPVIKVLLFLGLLLQNVERLAV